MSKVKDWYIGLFDKVEPMFHHTVRTGSKEFGVVISQDEFDTAFKGLRELVTGNENIRPQVWHFILEAMSSCLVIHNRREPCPQPDLLTT